LKETGLDSFTTASYAPPEIKDGGRTAKVKATFETKQKRNVLMNVTLTQESGKWRVFSLTSPGN
jgi:ABC-type transporter MlaC component